MGAEEGGSPAPSLSLPSAAGISAGRLCLHSRPEPRDLHLELVGQGRRGQTETLECPARGWDPAAAILTTKTFLQTESTPHTSRLSAGGLSSCQPAPLCT